jgi:hypothetical protein
MLRVRTNRGHQGMRRSKRKRMRPEGKVGVPRRRRNRAEEAAGERISGEEFPSLHCGSSGEAKGERERTARGSYSCG